MNANEWHIISQSVRGASHVRSGLPNQDAIACLPESGAGPPLILAVSDGHGSSKSFRSHLGAALAVEHTVALIAELVDLVGESPPSLSVVKRTAEERLPRELVRRWEQAVDAHLAQHPFLEAEFERLVKDRGESARRQVERHPRLAYGATLLAVLVAESFLLFLQLGDGDMLVVSEAGEVAHALVRDPRLIANETTSLCMNEAWREVRMRFQARHGDPPALIVVSTDGYANSFVNDAAFLKVGSDLLEILQSDGVPAVQSNLLSWLEEASVAGSGDDITLGIIYRGDVVSHDPGTRLDETALACDAPARGTGGASDAEVPADATPASPVQAEEPVSAPSDTSRPQRHLERIKHEGPRERVKRGPLSDLSEDSLSQEGERGPSEDQGDREPGVKPED